MNPIALAIVKLFHDPTEEKRMRIVRNNRFGHEPTHSRHLGLRGKGYTKRSHEESKAHRKMAAQSRKINRRKK